MRLLIVTVGRLRAGSEGELSRRYQKRINQLSPTTGLKLTVREISESNKQRPQERREDDARSIEAGLPAGAILVCLDSRGTQCASEELAERLSIWRDRSVADIALVIGGADGLSETLTGKAQLVLSLGKMTWPHQLVRVMLAEQLYRAMTIMVGHPYHRG